MNKVFRHKVPIYDCMFYFIVTQDIKTAHGVYGLPWLPDCCTTNGGELHISPQSPSFFLFLNPECVTHAFIAHEIAHAAHAICLQVGIEADHNNDEAESYLIYHLHEWVYNQLHKAGVVVARKEKPRLNELTRKNS